MEKVYSLIDRGLADDDLVTQSKVGGKKR